jgi:hypothetical protein
MKNIRNIHINKGEAGGVAALEFSPSADVRKLHLAYSMTFILSL